MPSEIVDKPPVQPETAADRWLATTVAELQRIVLDIHDGPVQHLFAAQAQVSLLQRRLARGEPVEQDEIERFLERLASLLREVQHELRGFLGAFRSSDFAQQDLAALLRGLVRQHTTFTGCEVVFTAPEHAIAAALPVKLGLYRICQEALANAYRHSGAQRCQVQLAEEEGMIVLTISDEGQGFTPPLHPPYNAKQATHIGLRGMRERAELLGGCCTIASLPGVGTRVTVKAPNHV
ncbi:MAG: sensor histidine kinase [Caldilineaceae bacterium]